jgi:hypothetical protein
MMKTTRMRMTTTIKMTRTMMMMMMAQIIGYWAKGLSDGPKTTPTALHRS